MNKAFAQEFGQKWVAAWNNHDLDEILSRYAEDFEMTSPIIKTLAGEPSGTLKGKQAVKIYWSKAIRRHPDLHFELLHVFAGIGSVVVFYNGHRGLSAEVFQFDKNYKVSKACAHYEQEGSV